MRERDLKREVWKGRLKNTKTDEKRSGKTKG